RCARYFLFFSLARQLCYPPSLPTRRSSDLKDTACTISFLVNCLIFCVPTFYINDWWNNNIVLNTLITEFITLCIKHHMMEKMPRSEEHTSELQSRFDIVCRLLLEKKKQTGSSVGSSHQGRKLKSDHRNQLKYRNLNILRSGSGLG